MSAPSYNAPKGTRDIVGDEAKAFQILEEAARRAFRLFGFSEIRTPLFESVELFSRSLGSTSDVVQKEMFTFVDRGERTFALRPEGTAGVVRYFIENSLASKGGTHRFYYMGPMFRAERPQAGRYRQFWQIGSEYFGSADASADADTVLMAARILQDVGLSEFSIHVNSIGCKDCRPRHREALLSYLKTKESELSPESRERMKVNPLRVLDSKVDGPKLTDAPAMTNFLCAPCQAHYALFLTLMNDSGVGIQQNPRLVRGLDYYTRTVFEFVSADLGAQSALAAGGRYDELVEHLDGPSTPGVGFALGMDRVVAAAQKKGTMKALKQNGVLLDKSAFVIPLDEKAILPCFSLAQSVRKAGIAVPPIHLGKKLKNQLSHAVESGAHWAVLIGENELNASKATVKNLLTREQISIGFSSLAETLAKAGEN